MITSSRNFELFLLLESMVQLGTDFKQTLSKVRHPIANAIIDAIDPETNTISTEEDVKDAESIHVSPSPEQIIIQKPGKPINPNNSMKVGKFVRKISSKFSPDEIESFVTAYKAAALENRFNPIIKTGEDIRRSYLESNYSIAGKGDFAKNCMRGEKCQDFLDLYVNNPSKISLVVQLDDLGKIIARALLWKTDQGEYVLDKIYAIDPGWKAAMQRWADDMGYFWRAHDDSKPFNAIHFIHKGTKVSKEFTVTVNNHQHLFYPFLDTFAYMTDNGVLYNYRPKGVSFYLMQTAEGLRIANDYAWWNDYAAETHLEIMEFMEHFGIEEYDFNDDMSVVINQNIKIIYENLRQFPCKISVIYGNVELTGNDLENLNWMPESVFGNVDISGNSTLTNLKGMSKYVHGNFIASMCGLRDLEGGPEIVKGEYDVRDNELRNVKGLAKNISKDLDLRDQRSGTHFKESEIREISTIKGDILL